MERVNQSKCIGKGYRTKNLSKAAARLSLGATVVFKFIQQILRIVRDLLDIPYPLLRLGTNLQANQHILQPRQSSAHMRHVIVYMGGSSSGRASKASRRSSRSTTAAAWVCGMVVSVEERRDKKIDQ